MTTTTTLLDRPAPTVRETDRLAWETFTAHTRVDALREQVRLAGSRGDLTAVRLLSGPLADAQRHAAACEDLADLLPDTADSDPRLAAWRSTVEPARHRPLVLPRPVPVQTGFLDGSSWAVLTAPLAVLAALGTAVTALLSSVT